jgi:hypothetical protein
MRTILLMIAIVFVSCQGNDAKEPHSYSQEIQVVDPVTGKTLTGRVRNGYFIFNRDSVVLVLAVNPDKLDEKKLEEIDFYPNAKNCTGLEQKLKTAITDKTSKEWVKHKKDANEFIGIFAWRRISSLRYHWPEKTIDAVKAETYRVLGKEADLLAIEIHDGELKANTDLLLSPLVYEKFDLKSLRTQIMGGSFDITVAEYCDLIGGNLWAEIQVRYDGQWNRYIMNFIEKE